MWFMQDAVEGIFTCYKNNNDIIYDTKVSLVVDVDRLCAQSCFIIIYGKMINNTIIMF